MKVSILTDRQMMFLDLLGKQKNLTNLLYLTGGTPLAAFYLHHRYSEDLDFFSEEEIDIETVSVFVHEVKRVLGAKMVDFQQSFNRNLFFLHFPDEVLKIEFTYFPFPRIQKGIVKHGVIIDSLLDIAVNKLFTIYQRTKARDYIDLYMICQKEQLALKDLAKRARVKFDWHIDPLQLGVQFMKAQRAEDLPRMIASIKESKWREFFLSEAKKLRADIFEG